MSTVLPIVVGLVCLACPLHMWWSHRKGRPGCMPMSNTTDAESVRLAQQRLKHAVSDLAASAPAQEPRRGA